MRKTCLMLFLIIPLLTMARQENILSKIKTESLKINTLEASFVQTKTISFIDEKLISTGEFLFVRPDKMRWEYQKPFYYSIIINGDNVVIIDEDKQSEYDAASNAMFGQIKQVIINMVNGKMFEDSDYHATLKEEPEFYIVQFETVNETMKEYISSIDLYFTKDKYRMFKIVMNEASGDNTIIEFSNQKINTVIPDERFKP